MYALKLVEFKPDDPENKYRLAVARERSENWQSARLLMSQLAGEDSSGMPKAHIWLARYHLMNPDELDVVKEDEENLAIEHFEYALEAEPGNLIALLGLSEIYENRGDIEQAAKYLGEALSSNFVSLLQLRNVPRYVKMQQDLGREELAKQQLRSFISKIGQLTRLNSEMFDIWLVQVQCATMLKDYDLARQIIEDAHQTVRDAETRENLIRLLSDVSVIEADEYKSIEDKENYQACLFALCEAIRTNPRSREAYSRLIEFAAPETLKDEKALWLRDSILGCPNPAVIHVILGMQEIKDGDFVQGQKHWRIADKQFELSQFIVNNMIELAVSEKPTEFGNLLDMITVALELFPDQAALYQTRGLYYKLREDYALAIKDLEYTVEKLPVLISARQLLMECYKATGDKEKAKLAQREIDKMVSELDEGQRAAVEAFMKQQKEQRAEDG